MPQKKMNPERLPNDLSRPEEVNAENFSSARSVNVEPQLKDSDFEKRSSAMVDRWQSAAQGKQIGSGIAAAPTTSAPPGRHAPDRIVARSSAEVAGTRMDVLAGHVVEPKRVVPVLDRCEVLVVGAGPSGLSAAIGAARAGADTMLIEKFGCFGGVISTVGMETLGWYRYEGTSDTEGIGREMERAAERMGGTTKWPYNDSQCLDGEQFKIVADRLVKEHGIRPLLHILVSEVIMEGKTVKGVITESKSGRAAIVADRVIDCTGDADVAFLAGAAHTTIDKNHSLGVTSVFNAAGVDKDEFLKYTQANTATYADWSYSWEQETSGKENDLKSPYFEQQFRQAADDGVIPQEIVSDLCGSWSALSPAGEATNLNLVHQAKVDCTDVRDLTRAEILGRENVQYALKALKHTIPGFQNAKLRNFSMTLGTRDSRKIVGKYNLTGEDVRGQLRCDDTVGVFPEFIDGYSILILPTSGRYFQVPYGCITPVKVDNLLVAGRAVSGDRVSHAAMRNMMACTVTGQAAGVAAAVSFKAGVSTHDVDVKLVQEELRRQGVRLD